MFPAWPRTQISIFERKKKTKNRRTREEANAVLVPFHCITHFALVTPVAKRS